MASVYILYSKTLDRFYIGSCLDFQKRMDQHQNSDYSNAFTARAADWELFLHLSNLTYEQARSIESHVKRMKSKKYILNLNRYPEILERLINKIDESGLSR